MITPNPQYKVPNISDKFGDIIRTRNINLDLQGYAQLSPRMAMLYSENDDNDFALPLAIGKYAIGEFQVLTGDRNFGVAVGTASISTTEDTGSNTPQATLDSDGAWFQGLWHACTATAVLSRPASGGASQAWTSRITGLTSGVRHIIRQHKSRVQLCVSNGNVVKQYDTSYSGTTDLTIPADYEISGMEYNNGYMGIITRLASNGTTGNDNEAMFYQWSGASTSANISIGLGSDAGIAIFAYKSSFVVVTRSGELKYFNGAGFQTIATFPFYFTQHTFGDAQNNNALGNVFGYVAGDNIHINFGNDISIVSRDGARTLKTFPAGIWCYDPAVGLYQMYSPSISKLSMTAVTAADVNISTNILTTSDTVPSTGNIARFISTGTAPDGISINQDYYVIKVSSTTFKLAETREHARNGTAIDITSQGADTHRFIVIEHNDYGASQYLYPGACGSVGDVGNNYPIYTDIIAGARLNGTDGSDFDTLSIAVPWLENVGVIETRRYSSEVSEDAERGFEIRFKPLNNDSSIRVYSKTEDVLSFPLSTYNDSATWLGTNILTTARDLTAAQTYLESGGAVLMEILSGAGGGNVVAVTSIKCEGGVCSVELEEDVFGVQSGYVCDFIIDNYRHEYTITSDNNEAGYVNVMTDMSASKFAQFLIVPVGYDVTIEQYDYKSTPHK